MFNLTEIPCEIKKVNSRAERHGSDERVFVQDIEVEARLGISKLPKYFAEVAEQIKGLMFFDSGLQRVGGLVAAKFSGEVYDLECELVMGRGDVGLHVDVLKNVVLSKPEPHFSVLLGFQLRHHPEGSGQAGEVAGSIVQECRISLRQSQAELEFLSQAM